MTKWCLFHKYWISALCGHYSGILGDITLKKKSCPHRAYILDGEEVRTLKPCPVLIPDPVVLVYHVKWWTLRRLGVGGDQTKGGWRQVLQVFAWSQGGRSISGGNKWLSRSYIWNFGIKTGQDLHPKFLPVERPVKINLPDRVRKVRN